MGRSLHRRICMAILCLSPLALRAQETTKAVMTVLDFKVDGVSEKETGRTLAVADGVYADLDALVDGLNGIAAKLAGSARAGWRGEAVSRSGRQAGTVA
jgi:hypothetical protein